jgi:phenylacetate-coenzyme A ligase PaaK-like adenylate-forming protein
MDREKVQCPEGKLAWRFFEAVAENARGNSVAVEEFRSALLMPTLRHAWSCSEYYRSTLPDSVRTEEYPLDQLAKLPILTRERVEESPQSLRTSSETGIVQCTTGTSGRSVTVYRTREEISFLTRFQTELNSILDQYDECEKRLILNIFNDYHGEIVNLPRRGHVLTVGKAYPSGSGGTKCSDGCGLTA